MSSDGLLLKAIMKLFGRKPAAPAHVARNASASPEPVNREPLTDAAARKLLRSLLIRGNYRGKSLPYLKTCTGISDTTRLTTLLQDIGAGPATPKQKSAATRDMWTLPKPIRSKSPSPGRRPVRQMTQA